MSERLKSLVAKKWFLPLAVALGLAILATLTKLEALPMPNLLQRLRKLAQNSRPPSQQSTKSEADKPSDQDELLRGIMSGEVGLGLQQPQALNEKLPDTPELMALELSSLSNRVANVENAIENGGLHARRKPIFKR